MPYRRIPSEAVIIRYLNCVDTDDLIKRLGPDPNRAAGIHERRRVIPIAGSECRAAYHSQHDPVQHVGSPAQRVRWKRHEIAGLTSEDNTP